MDQIYVSRLPISAGQLFSPDRLRLGDYLNYDLFKRLFDLVGAAILLMAVSPLLVVITLLLSFSGPVLFTQSRLTKGGKLFNVLKFRTMLPNAEAKSGPQLASRNDPRITRLGSFLRRTRMDELPQLLNVLAGDMSLIGPRPERPEFAARLSEKLPRFNERLQVKAGLTGLAQVRAGYASSYKDFRKKLSYDLIYIQNRCLLLDLRIAFHTIGVVITGKGAQ